MFWPEALLLVVESVLLEAAAVRSLSLGLVGPLALALQGQWRLALVAVALALAVRALVRGWDPRETLASLGVAALSVPAVPWGLLAYPFVSWAVPVALSRNLTGAEAVQQARTRRETAGVGLLVPCLAWLQVREPWAGLLCLVGIQLLLQRLDRGDPAAPVRAALAETQGRLEKDALVRHQLTQELAVLEALSRSLAGCATLKASLETVLAAVERAVPGSSCAIFGAEREPLAWRSPRAERLESAVLLGLSEPVVSQAYARRARLEAGPEQLTGERIFEGEAAAVALYLEAGGVLYWGGPQPPGEAQLALLAVIADQASLALLSGRQRDQLALALAAGESRRVTHQQWVDRLVTVLDGLRELVSSPELLGAFVALVERCVPHRGGAVLVRGELVHSWGEAPDLRHAGTPRPLLLEGLLVAPVLEEQLVVLLTGEFDRDQQTLVGLLAYLLSVLHQRSQSQHQLVQASKLAAVGQLAAGVAHELNTPLGAVGLSLDALKKQVTSTALKRVELAAAACRQCQEIVAKLLIFCRTDDQVQPLSLNEVLAETLLVVRSHLARQKIVMTTDLGEVPAVLANRNDLQQVLTNLVMNAAHGAKAITVRTWMRDGAVFLSVRDDGPGMAPEVLARAFEPFFTTKPVGQGTGLGLSISREVMQKLGGDVQLESRLGEGTTATVRLPCAS